MPAARAWTGTELLLQLLLLLLLLKGLKLPL
jgi:hypothetical protein